MARQTHLWADLKPSSILSERSIDRYPCDIPIAVSLVRHWISLHDAENIWFVEREVGGACGAPQVVTTSFLQEPHLTSCKYLIWAALLQHERQETPKTKKKKKKTHIKNKTQEKSTPPPYLLHLTCPNRATGRHTHTHSQPPPTVLSRKPVDYPKIPVSIQKPP